MGDPTAINIQTDPLAQRMRGTTRHKNMYFDVTFISHIHENLYQGGCQTGLVLPTNIEHLISLYPWESYTIHHEMKSRSYHWLYDSDEKPSTLVDGIGEWVSRCMEDGPTLLHCQAGINRSSLVAVLALKHFGYTAEQAIKLLREKRSPAVLCNPSFERYLLA